MMATITPTKTMVLGDTGLGDTGSYIAGWKVSWAGMGSSDTPVPVATFPGFANKSWQVEGTMTSIVASLLGSNDGVNFEILPNLQGTASTSTASTAGIFQCSCPALQIKPNISAGTGPVTVTVFFANTQTRP